MINSTARSSLRPFWSIEADMRSAELHKGEWFDRFAVLFTEVFQQFVGSFPAEERHNSEERSSPIDITANLEKRPAILMTHFSFPQCSGELA